MIRNKQQADKVYGRYGEHGILYKIKIKLNYNLRKVLYCSNVTQNFAAV